MLTLQFQYKPLFRINLENNYFKDRQLRGYSLKPSTSTLRTLDSLGLIVRKSDTGVDILADNCKLENLYLTLDNLKNETKILKFLLYIKDPFFKNYTDIPFDTTQKILYFSNEYSGVTQNGLMHVEDSVSEKDLFKLTDNNHLEGKEDVVLPSDMKGLAIGMVDIILNKTFVEQITDKLMDSEIITFDYSICFNSRSVVWKYFIIPTYTKKLKGLKITGQKESKGVKFSSAEEVVLKNKKEALIFTSDKPLKYQQFCKYSFQLKRGEGENGGKTIISKLQFASIEGLKPLNSNDSNNYYSEIYVYI